MIKHLALTLSQTFSKDLRPTAFKVIGLTLLTLILLGVGIHQLAAKFLTITKWAYVETALEIIAALGLVLGAFFLIAPASAIMTGFFGDTIASKVEEKHYGLGASVPTKTAILEGAKITALTLGINFIALLFLFTGIGIFVLIFANAYLMSREYYELAAMRFLPPLEAKRLRRDNAFKVFLYGLPIALLMLIPLVNLITPLFGIALMTHAFHGRRK